MAQQAHLIPAELEMQRDNKVPAMAHIFPVGSPRDQGRMPYDLFEPDLGRRTRQARHQWTMEELVQDAVHAVAYVVRCIQFPVRPLPRTYKPNVIMTPARAGRERLALPFDLRDVGCSIVTILAEHGMTIHAAMQQVQAKVATRFPALTDLIARGQLSFSDSRGRAVDILVAPLVQYEWVRVLPADSQPDMPEVQEDVEDLDPLLHEYQWPRDNLPPAQILFTPEPDERSIIRAGQLQVFPAAFGEEAVFTAPTSSYKWALVMRETLGHSLSSICSDMSASGSAVRSLICARSWRKQSAARPLRFRLLVECLLTAT